MLHLLFDLRIHGRTDLVDAEAIIGLVELETGAGLPDFVKDEFDASPSYCLEIWRLGPMNGPNRYFGGRHYWIHPRICIALQERCRSQKAASEPMV